MIRLAACALAVLVLAGTAAGAPARSSSDVTALEQAIKKEQLAIQELKFRHGDAARERLNESRVLLAGVADHASAAVAEDLRGAESLDEQAITWSEEKRPLANTVMFIQTALAQKERALTALKKQPSGLGCIALAGESKKFPGETEITIRGCDKTVTEIVLTYPVKVKSTSQAAVVSSKIPGGLAVSKCIEPTPTTIDCGNYPNFLPAGGTFILDVLPHLKPSQKVEVSAHVGVKYVYAFSTRTRYR